MSTVTTCEFAPVFRPLFKPARFKVSDGGRGGGRSWAYARYLLIAGVQNTERILCCREYQTSIASSVHQLLKDQIEIMGFSDFYTVTRENIAGKNGTLFLFKGLHHNASDIKSTEGVTKAWVEEAEKVSEESWSFLIPTIRLPGSEILITFNPYREKDATYQRFIVNPPPWTVRMRAGWRENPWFPDVLKLELEHDKKTDIDRYNWIWEGNPIGISDAQVYKGKFEVTPFETPTNTRFFFGADWGFAKDPNALVRCWIKDKCLYIDHEAYGVGVEIDETPALFDTVPESRRYKMYGDSARPETISYMRRNGYPLIASVPKWHGSVEDGISYIRSFEKIYIHPRCRHMADEMEVYRYKTDRVSGEILPLLVDADNHLQDALRYALTDYIRARGASIPSSNVRGAIGI